MSRLSGKNVCWLITPDSIHTLLLLLLSPPHTEKPESCPRRGRPRVDGAPMGLISANANWNTFRERGWKKKKTSVELIYQAVAANATPISLCQSRIWLVIFPTSVTDGLALTIKGRLSSCRGAESTMSGAPLCGRGERALCDFISLLEDFVPRRLFARLGVRKDLPREVTGIAAGGQRDGALNAIVHISAEA